MVRTEDLPAAYQFECWYELTRGPTIPVISQAPHTDEFPATARRLDLNAVRAYSMTGPTVRATRSARLVRQCDPDHCSLYVIVRGEYRYSQAGQTDILHAGDMVLADSSLPFDGWLIGDQARARLFPSGKRS